MNHTKQPQQDIPRRSSLRVKSKVKAGGMEFQHSLRIATPSWTRQSPDAQVGLGHVDAAVASYEEALRQYRASGHSDHPEVAYALHNDADAEVERGRAGPAEALYLEAIARKGAIFGSSHHELAASLNNLAALLAGLGRLDEARARSREAVAAVQTYPSTHPVRRGCEQFAAALA